MSELNPVTADQMYFAKAAGMDVETPKPVTANQMFLAKMAGMDVQTPSPVTVDQMLMQKVIDNGGSGGGGSGGSAEKKWLLKDVSCTTAALNATGIVPEVGKFYVLCSKSSTIASGWSPACVGKWTNGVLNFYTAVASTTASLTYSESGGWVCSDAFHNMIPPNIAICEWE